MKEEDYVPFPKGWIEDFGKWHYFRPKKELIPLDKALLLLDVVKNNNKKFVNDVKKDKKDHLLIRSHKFEESYLYKGKWFLCVYCKNDDKEKVFTLLKNDFGMEPDKYVSNLESLERGQKKE